MAAADAPALEDLDVLIRRWDEGCRRGMGEVGRKVDRSHVGVLTQVDGHWALALSDGAEGAVRARR